MTVELRENLVRVLSMTTYQLDRALTRQDYKALRQLQQDADRVLADLIADTAKESAPVLAHRKGAK